MQHNNKLLYFAYGSNMDFMQMIGRCPDCSPLGVATLLNYKITEREFADIDYEHNECVCGVLYEISIRDLLALDRYGGFPNFYIRKVVSVNFEGKRFDAIAYQMTNKNKASKNNLKYSKHYRELCSNAAKFWQLDQNHFQKGFLSMNVKSLMKALYSDNWEQIEAHLKAGVNVNEPVHNGWTPFMWACNEYFETKMIKMFLDAGGDVNSRNELGRTPLIIAARRRSCPQTLELLVRAGCDPNAKDNNGDTALDLASKHPQARMREAVVQFLKEAQNGLHSNKSE